VKCAILDAYYSDVKANAIAEHIDCVIGMSHAIDERTAIAFAVGFFVRHWGAGRSIGDALRLGEMQIRLRSISENLAPALIMKSSRKQTMSIAELLDKAEMLQNVLLAQVRGSNDTAIQNDPDYRELRDSASFFL
jgi:hypothetical protein